MSETESRAPTAPDEEQTQQDTPNNGSTSNDSEEREFEPITGADRAELASLAGELQQSRSLMRTLSQVQTSDLLARYDSKRITFGDPFVYPANPHFDVYKWAKMMLRVQDEKGISRHRSGVAFRNLSVHGSGEAINIQHTVGSFVRWPLKIHHLFKKSPKRQILYDFSGLVKKGELLVVLGRPGSGCSTLLKSMTGELHGLVFGPDAVVHYNGGVD